MTIDWDEFRCNDGTLDLNAAFERLFPTAHHLGANVRQAYAFLDAAQEIHPIRSRQVAAMALAYANTLALA